MQINHVALYVRDLEAMREFYCHYLGAVANSRYHNPRTGLQTYFLSFGGQARLEIMTRPDLVPADRPLTAQGFIHLAISVGSQEQVDLLTQKLQNAGYPVISGPRTTGDGYYESCVLDPEGNQIELVE